MSNPKKLQGTNPFCNIDVDSLPQGTQTDYHKECDDYIIEYGEVEHLIEHGEDDTDFVVDTRVEELSRISRDKYIQSYESEVGILNIIEKVRKTGDTTLLNQVSRSPIASHEKDSLGRPVEDIVDISRYQVDKVDALESFKKGASSFDTLPAELKGKLSLQEVAYLSDDEILKYLASIRATATTGKEEVNDESSK